MLDQLAGADGLKHVDGTPLDVSVGVATFPHDGTDLSQLLRVAKRRAEASLTSVVERLSLRQQPLGQLVDALVGRVETPTTRHGSGPESPQYIELPAMDVVGLALGAVQEAARGGKMRVFAVQRAGISVGGAVRAELVRDSEGVRFDGVDVSNVPGCATVEALAIIAEHGVYALVGRSESNVVRAVHASDPLLVDLLVQRFGEVLGARLFD